MIREFKTTRAKDENIKVKLKGFKNAYQLENTKETPNKVSIETYYDVMKRKTVKREIIDEKFNDYFTADKPVIFNFHGYPAVIQQLLFNYENTKRFFIN